MEINNKLAQINEVNRDLLKSFLEPYKEDCKYLKKAYFNLNESSEEKLNLGFIKGEFAIPYSCYIDDTGHFNSVEFNICYNQLFYILIAHSIENKLLEVMEDWDLTSYKKRQLSDFLIVKFASNFKRPIDSDRFEGILSIKKYSARKNLIILKTYCAFSDVNGGFSDGEVTIAVLNKKEEQTIENNQKQSLFAAT